ncbi:DUF4917 family protein [Salinisphaera sp. T31B1]|uniref:DUF4917 family protein n=1 Tax=Salinisphaera sp. T31B1 TaxID=727963 RepID=UPI0033424AB6
MPFEIYNWGEISGNYGGTLLLGNGASRAVDARFGYRSLLEYASYHGLLSDDVQRLFEYFETEDFELILRLVWHASNVNQSLGIPDDRTRNAYVRVRDSLISTVRDIHPEHQEVYWQLPTIYNFVKNFDTAITLNYDLILYWVIMYGQEIFDGASLKDCFIHGEFDENWRRLRQPIRGHTSSTLAFYPHGNLVLARNFIGSEGKLVGRGEALLESILDAWETGRYVPLFVSEGTAAQKVNSIRSSGYLSTVYREVFTSLSPDLVIYGWGLWEQDLYILDPMHSSNLKRVACSVYGDDQAYCNRVYQIIRQNLGPEVYVEFFYSDSPGCWNNGA